MRIINGLWYAFVTITYMVLVLIGMALSYPMVIVVIAWQQALTHAEKIKKHLS